MTRQISVFILAAVVSWYGMMAVHEAGHCLGAVLSGGRVQRVSFPIRGFSQTHYESNPHPLFTVWTGPIGGIAIPLALLGALPFASQLVRHLILFFTGFCLIANGVYLGYGALLGVGDCFDLLLLGASRWHLVLFGIAATASGLYTWHRMGPLHAWFTPSKHLHHGEHRDTEKKV
jgi:hypothetical protein